MSSFVKKCCVVTPCNLFYVFWGKGLQFFLFCDVFRRITTQKQLFFAERLRCIGNGSFLCACNVFGLWRQFALHEASCRARWCAKESSNLSRYTTQAMQPRRQSLLGHGLSPYKKTISHCFLRERAPDEAA